MSERKTIPLKHPIEFGKETITELSMRPGRLGDLKGVKIGDPNGVAVDDLIKVAARMCGQPTAVIDKLSDADAAEVLPLVMGFFGRCLRTGTEDSQSSE